MCPYTTPDSKHNAPIIDTLQKVIYQNDRNIDHLK